MMNDVLEKIYDIKQKKFEFDEMFDLAHQCAAWLNGSSEDEKEAAYKLLIRALDKWEYIPKEVQPIWMDLIESAGFYPYISRYNDSVNWAALSDRIRMGTFKSKYMEIVFHKEQKKFSDLLFSGENIVISAPTSFGKSILMRV